MATSYAALVSLMNLLNRIQLPPCPVFLDKLQIQSLFHKVCFLIDFLENYSGRESKESKGLERPITYAAYVVEDILESYIVEQTRAETVYIKDIDHAHFFRDLQKAIEEIDFIREEVMKINEKKCEEHHLAMSSVSVGSLVHSSAKSTAVGLEENLVRLMDQLTSNQSSRRIISVVGMGGIGKTTLAINVYENPFVINHFHVRIWVTISQSYSVERLILDLLHGIGVGGTGDNAEQLGEKLYRCLIGRKYLIVLDDIWSSEAWESIRRFFPDDNSNGSRILLTTRLSNVALGVGSCCPYEMELLDDDKSWDLFSGEVFGQEVCPPELEKLGKQIAESCQGLPLAIVVISGLLKTSQTTRKYWEDVAENVESILNTQNDEHCLKILSMSYSHLPIHLKPCFLYMATFPEDGEIRVSKLIRLWVSDGFLKPTIDKTLEEVAVEHLNDLIDRNLVMIRKRGSSGRVKSCILHDLLRDLCLREAQKERFLCVIKDLNQRIQSERRFVMNERVRSEFVFSPTIYLPSVARSLVYNLKYSTEASFRYSLLRILHTFDALTAEAIDLVHLRYLAFSAGRYALTKLFSSISLLANLETLVVEGTTLAEEVTLLPLRIWELRHLRHLIFSEKVTLPDPVGAHADLVLNNLQTLSTIVHFSCTDEVLNRMPNLKKLGMYYDMNELSLDLKLTCCFNNLVHCHKLETLKCVFQSNESADEDERYYHYKCVLNELEALLLLHGLKKLTLRGSNLPWVSMTILGSRPNLEVLKLQEDAFHGEAWNSIEGEFQRLKYLSIDTCDLAIWEAESSHFPRLECLVLRSMLYMHEIPCGIGEVMSLESIRLDYCSVSAVISARKILEEQQSLGNDDLLIHVLAHSRTKQELQRLAADNPGFLITFR